MYFIIKELFKQKNIKFKLIITGQHLSKSFHNTYKDVQKDGFEFVKIKTDVKGNANKNMISSMCNTVKKFNDFFEKERPDIILILGDRYEIFSVALSAYLNKVFIAHIHGGETSEGAIDEGFRHSISKFSHIHFVTNNIHKKRILNLGENKSFIFNYGAPGLDHIFYKNYSDRAFLQKKYNFKNKKFILLTYHPTTLSKSKSIEEFQEVIKSFRPFDDILIFITGVNSDPDNAGIIKLINNNVKKYKKFRYIPHFGQKDYLGMMKLSVCIIGNSSSGLIEAPAMKKISINVGDRQKSRLKSKSVIDCKLDSKTIIYHIKKCLNGSYNKILNDSKSLYGSKPASKKIIDKLIKTDLPKTHYKKFYMYV